MTISTAAITAHAGLSVSGTYPAVSGLYSAKSWTLTMRDIDAIPNQQDLGSLLPVMFPIFFEGESAGTTPTSTIGSGDVEQTIVFLCLVENPQTSLNMSFIGAKTLIVMDTYINACVDDPTLSATIGRALTVRCESGLYPWGEHQMAGFKAYHTWLHLLD